MNREITIREFEELLNLRVHMVSLQNRGLVHERNKLQDLTLKYNIAANKILTEHEISDLKAIFRGGKSFIIFKPTGRIACEIAVDGVYQKEYVQRDKLVLLAKKGFVRSATLQKLADFTAKQGKTVYSGLKREEINAKRNKGKRN